MDAGRQWSGVLTAIYIGLDLGYLLSGASAMWLARRGLSIPSARRVVFGGASAL